MLSKEKQNCVVVVVFSLGRYDDKETNHIQTDKLKKQSIRN